VEVRDQQFAGSLKRDLGEEEAESIPTFGPQCGESQPRAAHSTHR
jgi:hypothetical protein